MVRLYSALCFSAVLFLAFPGAAGLSAAGEAPADSLMVIPPGKGQFAEDDSVPKLKGMIIIDGKPVDIVEVVRKAQEGERSKYEGLRTLAYTQTMRLTMKFGGRKARTRYQETVQRVYYRAPDDWVTATLRDTTWVRTAAGELTKDKEDDEDEGHVRVSVRNEGASIANVPIYLERLDKFRFTRLGQSATDSTVLHRVRFEPMSDFGSLPGGTIWLLAPGYQIVREEYELKNLPYPWIFKKLDFLVREWQPIEGRWVQKRIAARARLGMNFLSVPEAAEFVVDYADYRFNPVLEDAIFSGRDR